jgi:pantoate--beta-alanine ligase
MIIARTPAELSDALAQLRREGSLALVPTMGALHAGHRALLARARRESRIVAASVFVNPTQFDARGDFNRYPRDPEADLAALREAACDLVWMPDEPTMYAPADATMVVVGGPAQGFEDDSRPGHFRGVATVVAKLFGQLRPDAAVFGEKDWQQLQVVARMSADLHLGVRVVGEATVRDPDGLALSSRNRFLAPEERARAPLLHRTLTRLAAELRDGRAAEPGLEAARAALAGAGFEVDYLALVDAASLRPLRDASGEARLIAAARLGTVRLLDNLAV